MKHDDAKFWVSSWRIEQRTISMLFMSKKWPKLAKGDVQWVPSWRIEQRTINMLFMSKKWRNLAKDDVQCCIWHR